MDKIAILDFGSQYSQLIARRVRELHVYSELFAWDTPSEQVMPPHPGETLRGFILSGGPASVYEDGAPQIPDYVISSGLPILGICYGMQALTYALGGQVAAAESKASSPENLAEKNFAQQSFAREYGPAQIEIISPNPLLPSQTQQVWMSHGDRIEVMPAGFSVLARSANSPVAAMGDFGRGYYGLQFHPEVYHTPQGKEILRRFVIEICQSYPQWTPESIIAESIQRIRRQVGDAPVLSAVSGGVDSSVATALVQRAVGEQLVAVFVDTGLLRQGEMIQVQHSLHEMLGVELIVVDAVESFMQALRGVSEPENKRRIIGEQFIRHFEEQARRLGLLDHPRRFLVQGTIYPDVVESSAPDRSKAQRIKSHHNVGGLPEQMQFELVEPLRYLFKDEVRSVGKALGLPDELVWRQPFPGPGLAVRCLGEINRQRLDCLRAADAIFISELAAARLLNISPENDSPDTVTAGGAGIVSQAFAVLLPVRSVGVMGDQRTYQEVLALRAVTTQDFMTADWARLPNELLGRVANRIVNEVAGVNRVVYDITSKPPATIEWE